MVEFIALRTRFNLRSIGAVAAVAAALFTVAPVAPSFAADDADAEVQTREVVDLELKIAAEGRAVGQIVRVVELDTNTSLALEVDGHEHAVDIMVRKSNSEDHTLAVTLGYQVDGEAVMRSLTIEAAAQKAQVVRSESGSVALSLTLAPKMVPVEEPPAPSRPRVEFEQDTNDPLAGLY